MFGQEIALIQIAIHHITGKEVQIKPPTNNKEVGLLFEIHSRAQAWAIKNNLTQIK